MFFYFVFSDFNFSKALHRMFHTLPFSSLTSADGQVEFARQLSTFAAQT